MHEALSRGMKNLPLKGRGLGHVTEFQILGPPFIFSERLKLETAYLVQHVLAIVWQITMESLISEMTLVCWWGS